MSLPGIRLGSLLSPTLPLSPLHPASSLRPTNGTSALLCLPHPQTQDKLAGLATFALKHQVPFWVFFEADMAVTPPHLPHSPHHRFSLGGRRAEWVCRIREARELGMIHYRLVSAVRGEMPSLPGCLSNKLAITGKGLQVNSMLLPFSTQGSWWEASAIERSSEVEGHSPPVSVSLPDETHKKQTIMNAALFFSSDFSIVI